MFCIPRILIDIDVMCVLEINKWKISMLHSKKQAKESSKIERKYNCLLPLSNINQCRVYSNIRHVQLLNTKWTSMNKQQQQEVRRNYIYTKHTNKKLIFSRINLELGTWSWLVIWSNYWNEWMKEWMNQHQQDATTISKVFLYFSLFSTKKVAILASLLTSLYITYISLSCMFHYTMLIQLSFTSLTKLSTIEIVLLLANASKPDISQSNKRSFVRCLLKNLFPTDYIMIMIDDKQQQQQSTWAYERAMMWN